jgi:hypothetical protein
MFEQLFTAPRAVERYCHAPLLDERFVISRIALREGAPGAPFASSHNIKWC